MPRRGSTDEQDTGQEQEFWGDQSEQDSNDQGQQDGTDPAPDDTPELSDEEKAAAAEIEAERVRAAIAQIEEFTEAPAELVEATVPTRKRGPLQLALDAAAVKAYAAWIEKDRPTVWAKLPVVTYYLDPEEVADWRGKIRKACEQVTPEGEASGVRARFGKEEFTLTEEMAAKIGKSEKAGTTVLSWAAVDKRRSTRTNGDTAATTSDDDDDD